jgi:hypothetical protein
MLHRPIESAVASRRWAASDEFHRLSGGKRPQSVIRGGRPQAKVKLQSSRSSCKGGWPVMPQNGHQHSIAKAKVFALLVV